MPNPWTSRPATASAKLPELHYTKRIELLKHGACPVFPGSPFSRIFRKVCLKFFFIATDKSLKVHRMSECGRFPFRISGGLPLCGLVVCRFAAYRRQGGFPCGASS